MNKFLDENINHLQNFESMRINQKKLANYAMQPIAASSLALPKTFGDPIVKSAPLSAPVSTYDIERAPDSAAMFDITMTRKTHNIAADLPAIVFGVLDRESDFSEILPQLLPVGCSYEVARTTDRKGLKFTYTLGANTDIIEVSCAQVPYLNLLRATQGSVLRMEQNKMNISDVSVQSQFRNKVQVTRNTMFGKDTNDSFTPNQFKSDMQNQNDIRTITANFNVDLETSFAVLLSQQSDFDVTITSYISKFSVIKA